MEINKKEKFSLIVIVIVIIFALGMKIYQSVQNSKDNGKLVITNPDAAVIKNSQLNTENEIKESQVENDISLNPDVIISQPLANENFSSPFAVSGKIKGFWFFEGTCPLKIIDEKDKVLGTGVAKALEDALTEEYVPFVGFIDFLPEEKPTTAVKGFLVVTNDNPSGLIENELSIKVPIIINPN